MTDLPIDRVSSDHSFTCVNRYIWTLGNCSTSYERRHGSGHTIAIMVSCIDSQTVHIEDVKQMSFSYFIDVLSRIIVIRGHTRKQF